MEYSGLGELFKLIFILACFGAVVVLGLIISAIAYGGYLLFTLPTN